MGIRQARGDGRARLQAPGSVLSTCKLVSLSWDVGVAYRDLNLHFKKTFQIVFERHRDRSSVGWVTAQVPTAARAAPGRSQEPGALSRSLMWGKNPGV